MPPRKDYYDPQSITDFLAKVGVNATTGLSRDDAMTRRTLYGANRVTPPVNCPSWVCCLLPCLLRTPSMVGFHAALPREASVKRFQSQTKTARTLRMDATSLVYGDVVEVKAGDVVGADLRVIECSDDCLVDQTTLVGEREEEDDNDALEGGERTTPQRLKPVTVSATNKTSPLMSGNALLMATRLVKGRAVGVVIATGDETVWGQLLENHEWPVKGTTRTKYGEGGNGEGDVLVNKV